MVFDSIPVELRHRKGQGCIYPAECLAVSEKDSDGLRRHMFVNRMSWSDECVGSVCEVRLDKDRVYIHVFV